MEGELKGEQERYFNKNTQEKRDAAQEIHEAMPIKHTRLEDGGRETFFDTNVSNVVKRQVTYPNPKEPLSETLIRFSKEGYDKRFPLLTNNLIKPT